ncbi:NAD(P)/FAD-dependent oxidoreductase [Sulfurospirillum sp. 1612]|uniref:NAD(P)/FAD-dependent oxidoreductase n=1 Tax=Sulfurospirillum sp. 1612 TaxID=3094835 RepID=UPI002F92B1A1
MFDFAIIGAGISGASVAFFLKQAGKKVIVIEQDKSASGGSGAAGAFLSPKIGSDSDYSHFINDSFQFSLDFYQKQFPKFLKKPGMLRLLRSPSDILKCQAHEQKLPRHFTYLKAEEVSHIKKEACRYGGYFFDQGTIIDSVGVIDAMLQDIEVVENTKVTSLIFEDGGYQIGSIKARGVILCAGHNEGFPQSDYCMLKKIYGHRLDIQTSAFLPFHIHKKYSVSASENQMISIGATHIPGYQYDATKDFTSEIDTLLQAVESYVDLGAYEIKKVHFGVRSATIDFFPVLGALIDAKATLKAYPYIAKGSKVPSTRYHYYPHLYVHSGHGARGFVLAPSTARILVDNICHHVAIPKRLDTKRLFLKYARRENALKL